MALVIVKIPGQKVLVGTIFTLSFNLLKCMLAVGGQQDYYKIYCYILQFKNTESMIVVPFPLSNLHFLIYLSRESDFKVRYKASLGNLEQIRFASF